MQAANDDGDTLMARTCEIIYTTRDLANFGMADIIRTGVASMNDLASEGARHITLVVRPHDTL